MMFDLFAMHSANLSVAYWCEHPELFAAIVDGKTPEDRALRVLKWFIVRIAFNAPF